VFGFGEAAFLLLNLLDVFVDALCQCCPVSHQGGHHLATPLDPKELE
jgi:hypothetical protein